MPPKAGRRNGGNLLGVMLDDERKKETAPPPYGHRNVVDAQAARPNLLTADLDNR